MKLKKCSKCGIEKGLGAFYKNKNYKDGIRSYCKACAYVMGKAWRKENKEKRAEYKNTWGQAPASYETYASQLNYAEPGLIKTAEGYLSIPCAYCGQHTIPTNREAQNRINALNGKGTGECRFYCSKECKKACPTYRQRKTYKGTTPVGSTREVPAEFRMIALKDRNYTCQHCGDTKPGLHVHHIEGYTEMPMFMADLPNVLVLCKHCHKKVHKQTGCRYYDYRCDTKSAEVTV